jgi:hypothetical protein
MIRKLKDGRYRLYSRKKDPKTGKRRNLGTFATRAAAMKHERAVQFFKRGGRSFRDGPARLYIRRERPGGTIRRRRWPQPRTPTPGPESPVQN